MNHRFAMFALMALLLVPWPSIGQQSRAAAEKELQTVRKRIQSLQQELAREGRRRTQAEAELQAAEKSEQSTRSELRKLREQVAAARSEQARLTRDIEARESELGQQQQALARQIRAAWMAGDQEWLRVALNQTDPAALGRTLTYYGYLARQRNEAIAELDVALLELAGSQAALASKTAELVQLEAATASRLRELESSRAERARSLASINAGMATRDAEIQRLQSQAAELDRLVAALARALPKAQDFSGEPFAGQAAKLDWPATGPVLRRFGQSRADGRLRWNGMLLGAPAGADVRAVYHGRVVFADWLDGMGLLMIIEHQGGYLSLYGHNQALLRGVGERVAPGDVIAQVGDTGGQAAAGLYFEIRKDGKPVDPARWIR